MSRVIATPLIITIQSGGTRSRVGIVVTKARSRVSGLTLFLRGTVKHSNRFICILNIALAPLDPAAATLFGLQAVKRTIYSAV